MFLYRNTTNCSDKSDCEMPQRQQYWLKIIVKLVGWMFIRNKSICLSEKPFTIWCYADVSFFSSQQIKVHAVWDLEAQDYFSGIKLKKATLKPILA